MLIRPQQAHESSMNASSACWKPRHWRQWSCPSSADWKQPQPEGHGWNGILKKMRPSVICSFRIWSFCWSAHGNRCWEGLRWLHLDANQEQIKRLKAVEINTLLIEGDTGVNSQTSPVPLPQKLISSRPNPQKNWRKIPVPFHSRKNDTHSLPLPCCCYFFLPKSVSYSKNIVQITACPPY